MAAPVRHTGFDVDAWLDNYQPRTGEVRLGADPALIEEHSRLNDQLRDAILTSDQDRAADLGRQVREIEQRIEASAKVFRIRAVTHKQWADLMRDHPPTDDQLTRNKLLDHNPDTFPVAAIAASFLHPHLTEDQVRRARDTLSNADFATLWEHVLLVNREVMAIPKSPLAGAVLATNNGSSTTAPATASHGRGSSAKDAGRSPRPSTPKAT